MVIVMQKGYQDTSVTAIECRSRTNLFRSSQSGFCWLEDDTAALTGDKYCMSEERTVLHYLPVMTGDTRGVWCYIVNHTSFTQPNPTTH